LIAIRAAAWLFNAEAAVSKAGRFDADAPRDFLGADVGPLFPARAYQVGDGFVIGKGNGFPKDENLTGDN